MPGEPRPCGCDAAPPIVCTLAGRAQQEQRAREFRDAFVHLERTERLEGAFRWHFRDAPGLKECLDRLAEREHDCCRFFDFRIARGGGAIVWETRGPAAAAGVMEELMRLPETLRAAASLTEMKRAMEEAGLTFPHDAPAGTATRPE